MPFAHVSGRGGHLWQAYGRGKTPPFLALLKWSFTTVSLAAWPMVLRRDQWLLPDDQTVVMVASGSALWLSQ